MAIIEIDSIKYEVEDGKNLLDACLSLGLDLPYFCWHPSMGSVGSCRQCAVRVYSDENDTRGRILMSCMTPVADGMRLSMEEQGVSEFREKCIEVTMANHPHDCPVCEEGGECHLQDVTLMSNHTERRYKGKKKTYENQNLGPCIGHEMNRCITCYRCLRFYKDYAGGKDLAAMGSRENTYFGRHEDGVLESIFSGNLAEVCPTGVFTDKTLSRSYNRKWDMQTAPSICHGCSMGCNISPAERKGKLKRITNRYHEEVNGYFICDKGRFAYDHVNSDLRLRECLVREGEELQSINYQGAVEAAASAIGIAGLEKCVGIGSELASVEENYLLKQLVGAKNFCSGMSTNRQNMLLEVLAAYRDSAIHIASLKEIEDCDAVLILGEDLMQSAPRMALSVRQSTRNLSFEMAKATRIPIWQDASVRILAQDARSPLIIAATSGTELDEIASDMVFASPGDIANFGFALANEIQSGSVEVDVSAELQAMAKNIAPKLKDAKNPLVISGTGMHSVEVIQAARAVARAISKSRTNGKTYQCAMSYVLPQANSLGLAMLLDEHSQSVDELVEGSNFSSSIVLNNNLHEHMDPIRWDNFNRSMASKIIISQLYDSSVQAADIAIPASSFMETEGTIVNNEGRAQRFFEVISHSQDPIKDNWRSIVNLAKALGHSSLSELEKFDDIVDLLASNEKQFSRWHEVAPSSEFRVAGMKMPRQPHRYSGRTSLEANVNVAELKQPLDDDSALSFSMEGSPINRPSSLNALIWSPGWNSNEAVNKFQDEIGGASKGGNSGVRLFDEKSTSPEGLKINCEPELKPNAAKGQLLAVCESRLLDGDELTLISSALALRANNRNVSVSATTASKFNLEQDAIVQVELGHSIVKLPLKIEAKIPDGLILIPNDVATRRSFSTEKLPALCQVEAMTDD